MFLSLRIREQCMTQCSNSTNKTHFRCRWLVYRVPCNNSVLNPWGLVFPHSSLCAGLQNIYKGSDLLLDQGESFDPWEQATGESFYLESHHFSDTRKYWNICMWDKKNLQTHITTEFPNVSFVRRFYCIPSLGPGRGCIHSIDRICWSVAIMHQLWIEQHAYSVKKFRQGYDPSAIEDACN